MPNRILRESILTSDRVNQLDANEERFYRRLMSVVDDYGRFDGRPSVVRAACFPLLLDKIRETDCSRWMAACQKAGLVTLYEVESKPFLELRLLGDPRAKHSKYPPPPANGAQVLVNTESESMCAHAKTSVPNSIPNSNSNAPTKARGKAAVVLPPIPKELDTPEFRKSLMDFIEHRRQKGKPVTALAASKLFTQLIPFGAAKATGKIDVAIANGWTGVVFPGDAAPKRRESPDQAEDRIRAEKQRESAAVAERERQQADRAYRIEVVRGVAQEERERLRRYFAEKQPEGPARQAMLKADPLAGGLLTDLIYQQIKAKEMAGAA